VLSRGYVRQKSEAPSADNAVEVDAKTLSKKAEEAKTILAKASEAVKMAEAVEVKETGSREKVLPGNNGAVGSGLGAEVQQVMEQ